MKNEGKYCCLGVLCKLRGTLTKGEGWFDMPGGSEEELSEDNEMHQFLGNAGDLPEKVEVSIDDDKYYSLAKINDESGLGFKSIAAIIRTIWKDGGSCQKAE